MAVKKILTTDNLKDIKRYVTKSNKDQSMTLDTLLKDENKKKLLNAGDNPNGGDATPQGDKTFEGVDIDGDSRITSTYQKFETTVNGFNNGSISPIPMYLKRENMAGVAGTNGGTGNTGYTGCQYAASQINYDSGQLTLSGLSSEYNGSLFYYPSREWLKTHYPNKAWGSLPSSISVSTNGLSPVGV